MILSRRTLGSVIFQAICGQWLLSKQGKAQPGAFDVDRLLGSHPYETAVADQSRIYRADAVVSLFSIQVFSRSAVGTGFARFRQARRGNSLITTSRFGGGSFPQRAHNLNRLGVIEEVVLERDAHPVEAAYFGFMTSSPEEGVAEARRSLQEAGDSVTYVAAQGYVSQTHVRTSKTKFSFPAHYTWSDRTVLLREVRTQFPTSAQDTKDADLAGGAWPGMFLHLIASAIRSHPVKFDKDYFYNAKQFHLSMDKSMDAKAGAGFAQKGLTKRPEAVAVFRGLIRKEGTSKITRFRIWIEEDGPSILPLRIELQARSFLSLAFEFDPALQAAKGIEEI